MSSGDVSGVVKSGSNAVGNIISTTTEYVSKNKSMFMYLGAIVVVVIVIGLYYECSKNCSKGKKNKLVSMLDNMLFSDDGDSDSKSDEDDVEDSDDSKSSKSVKSSK